jgi:hypothetical protein
MSLIHTGELLGVNPFDYMTELLRSAEELKQIPSQCMPWNYRDTRSGRPLPRLRNLNEIRLAGRIVSGSARTSRLRFSGSSDSNR